jgi:lipopolysaccharide export LptBFGC system permease protein LptF
MKFPAFYGAAVADAEARLLERRHAARRRAALLAAHARRRLASPVALLAALGAGFALGSRSGRRGFARLFTALQFVLAALSAVKAAE